MKNSWRTFELILSGIQICCGFIILFIVYLTLNNYYHVLWANPLMDHNAIIEVALRKNLTLVLISFSSFISAVFLIKNLAKGWAMSIITWVMFIIILIINSYRTNQLNPNELDLLSKFIIGFILIVFTAIITALNNAEFIQKYKPNKSTWLTIAVSIVVLAATKFI
jgi:multisubunit Na+/H+ antiporter MnhB subunit